MFTGVMERQRFAYCFGVRDSDQVVFDCELAHGGKSPLWHNSAQPGLTFLPCAERKCGRSHKHDCRQCPATPPDTSATQVSASVLGVWNQGSNTHQGLQDVAAVDLHVSVPPADATLSQRCTRPPRSRSSREAHTWAWLRLCVR